MILFDAMTAAGWSYDLVRDRWTKGDLWLTWYQARAAVGAAERGEEWVFNEPANDDEMTRAQAVWDARVDRHADENGEVDVGAFNAESARNAARVRGERDES